MAAKAQGIIRLPCVGISGKHGCRNRSFVLQPILKTLILFVLIPMIGKNLRSIRNIVNMTQSEFASELGISQQMISQFENGKKIPSVRQLVHIAETYGVSLDWLCDVSTEVEERCSKKDMFS